jgi:hypothetical protein
MLASMIVAQVLWAGGAVAGLPPAEKLEVSASAHIGSGVSLAGTGGKTLMRRSPVFLAVDVGFRHPALPWLEFAPTLLLELEGRVAFGLMPKLRAFAPLSRGRTRPSRMLLFGSLGVPVFIAPYTLVGVAAGVGVGVQLHEHFALVAEGTAAGYFLGSDLIEGGALGKLDVQVGLRVPF